MTKIPDKVATIMIDDFVHATIAGLRIEDTTELVEQYKVATKNYFFSPDYQLKRWDGKFKFFSNGNRTFLSMILDVVEDLKERGYKIKIKNTRADFHLEAPTVDKDYFNEYEYELGAHQIKAVNNILETHDGIIKVGTGGGKTLITAILADIYSKNKIKTIIVVPNKDLIVQTRDEIKQFGIDVGVYYGDEKTPEKPVVVSTWQSLEKNPKLITMFGAVMVDECHGSQADSLFKLLSNHGKNIPIRIGLTGTLPEHMCDKLKVFSVLGPVRANVKSEYLIRKGWLAKLNLLMAEYAEDFTEEWEYYKKVAEEEEDKNISYTEFKNHKLFPQYENEKSYLKTNPARLENIADIITTMTDEYGNSFILVNTIDFGKKLAKLLGEKAIFISSKIKDRKPIYDAFKTEQGLIGIATYSLASTGLNIPRIFNLFLIDGGKSSIKVIQSIGRGLRKAEDKDSVNLIDIYSNVKFSMRHARRRKKIYKEEKYAFTHIKIDYENEKNAVQKCLKTVKSLHKDSNIKDLEKEVLE